MITSVFRQFLLPLLCIASVQALALDRTISPDEAKKIAREAWIYGYPMAENYNSIYAWAIESKGDQYKGPMNQINNVPKVFGPQDTGVVTPNSDTPYSYLIMDLRREPLVVTLPVIEHDRYYSLQLVDLYSHNVDYLGTRRDGNGGGNFLIAGPGWQGKVPAGIKRVVHIPTSLMFSQFRTELKSPQDLDRVKTIQSQYRVEPLSAFEKRSPPARVAAVNWPSISREQIPDRIFAMLNFLLPFAPPLAHEKTLLKQFDRIGIAPGAPWPPALPQPVLDAIKLGQQDAQQEVADAARKVTSSKDYFGTPADMKGKYLERAVGAMLGLYGNTAVEALYPAWQLDASGQQLNASKSDYQLTFAANALPPVRAFWSITMYDGKTRFLVDNSLNRYLINSSMLPGLKRGADGSITLYLQHKSPGKDLETNWLPAPNGPIYVVMRLYLPDPQALNGQWKVPALKAVPVTP